MVHRSIFHIFSQWCRFSRYLLAICWFVGVLLGFYAATPSESNVSAARWFAYGQSAPWHIFLSLCIPVVVSRLAQELSCRWTIFILGFIKAFLFSYSATIIGHCFGSAGWLVRFLLLFSQYMTLPALYLYFDLLLRKPCRKTYYVESILFIYIAGVVIVDRFVIYPLLNAVFY